MQVLCYLIWHSEPAAGGKNPNATMHAAVHHESVAGVQLTDEDVQWQEQQMQKFAKAIEKIAQKKHRDNKYRFTLKDWMVVRKAFVQEWPSHPISNEIGWCSRLGGYTAVQLGRTGCSGQV